MKLHKYEEIDSNYMKDYVYKIIKKNIIELKIKPGTCLKKDLISEELRVSITPIREAFARLAEDELVDIFPQRGTYVSQINLHKIEQAKFMREKLEREVIKLACQEFPRDILLKLQTNLKMQRIYAEEENYLKLFEFDNRFHSLIFKGCKKGDIWTAIQQLSFHVSRLRILSLAENFNRQEVIIDHQNIIKAIKDKNMNMADSIIVSHIERIKFDTDKLKDGYPGYFCG